MSDDFTTKAGFFRTARKAVVGFVSAFVASFGPAIVLVTADGKVDWVAEVLPVTVVALGLAFAAGFAVWRFPNDPQGK